MISQNFFTILREYKPIYNKGRRPYHCDIVGGESRAEVLTFDSQLRFFCTFDPNFGFFMGYFEILVLKKFYMAIKS